MTHKDHQIIFAALGFLAIILQDDLPPNKRAERASGIARLIEDFCRMSVPDAFVTEKTAGDVDAAFVDAEIYRYKTTLRDNGSADLSHSREILIKIYDRLLVRKLHYEQHEFYRAGTDDLIANHILRLVEQEIKREERREAI